jgi:hypothetical protein
MVEVKRKIKVHKNGTSVKFNQPLCQLYRIPHLFNLSVMLLKEIYHHINHQFYVSNGSLLPFKLILENLFQL